MPRRAAITEEVIRRLAERFARGLPMRHACALEKNPEINPASVQKASQRHPEWRSIFDEAAGTFLESALERLIKDPDARNLRWVLERRHASDFGSHTTTTINAGRVISDDGEPEVLLGCPNSVMHAMRAYAMKEAKRLGDENQAARIKDAVEVQTTENT